MGQIISFERARQQRGLSSKPIHYNRILINCQPPSPSFLSLFEAEPEPRVMRTLRVKIDLGITVEPYRLRLPWATGVPLEDALVPEGDELQRISHRTITHVLWRSTKEDLAWEGLLNIRWAVVNSLICLIQQLNTLKAPIWISPRLRITTEVVAYPDYTGYSQFELTLR